MALKETHKYDDIIDLPHPVSVRHARMSAIDRAAQFAPFAALTGFEETIRETGRQTDQRIELEEEEKSRLDGLLRQIRERFPEHPRVEVTYFVYDLRKAGGSYRRERVRVRRLHRETGRMELADGRQIPIAEIIDLRLIQDPSQG